MAYKVRWIIEMSDRQKRVCSFNNKKDAQRALRVINSDIKDTRSFRIRKIKLPVVAA